MAGSSEPEFLQRMRREIYRMTDQDIGRDDPIYPILACQSLMARAVIEEVRTRDAGDLQDAAMIFAKEAARLSAESRSAGMKSGLMAGAAAAGGFIAGLITAMMAV